MMARTKKTKTRLIALLILPLVLLGLLFIFPPVTVHAASVTLTADFSVPTTAAPGATISGTLTVTNTASDPTDGALTVAITATGGTVNIPTNTINAGLTQNAPQQVPFTVTVTGNAGTTLALNASISSGGTDTITGGTGTASVSITAAPPVVTPAPEPDHAALTAEFAQRHTDYWLPVLGEIQAAGEGSVLAWNCNGMVFVPHYILTGLVNSKATAVLSWDTYTFTINGSNLGVLNPDLNYRFVDLYNLGLAK